MGKVLNMILEHIAIWTYQLEKLRDFYQNYFGGVPNERYNNPKNGFSSYFLSFERGSRLELMQMPGIPDHPRDLKNQFTGFIHMAFEADSEAGVKELTERLRADGYQVLGEPRHTGDGYYESVILDPDENRVEITYQPAQ